MNIKNILAVALLFFTGIFSQASYATPSCTTLQCTGPIRDLITSVFPTDAGDIIISSPFIIANVSCTGINGFNTLRLPKDHGLFEETYALILLAIANNENITFRLTDESIINQTTCELAFARLQL